MTENTDHIELRSEEVQEVLGASPSWILRAGISSVFAVIFIVLTASWFFKYPDIISSQISLTTQNPPAQLRAMTRGKITHLLIKENQKVEQGRIIAIIENTSQYKDVLLLEAMLDTLTQASTVKYPENLQLGEIQQAYASFLQLTKDYKNYCELDFYAEKIRNLQIQKKDNEVYYQQIVVQRDLKQSELKLANEQFKRDQSLYTEKVLSQSDYEKAEKQHIQEQLTFENTKASLTQTRMQINKINQQISELRLQDIQERQAKIIATESSLENLKSQIQAWKQAYVISSPIKGTVTLTQIWSTNQNIQTGEVVATVIPDKARSIIGKIQIPALGAGKVRQGQTINIKLDNYPHMEFGLLKGKLSHISLVPVTTQNGVIYIAEVEIPSGMTSNYGKQLAFSQEMTGTAEIITDDIRLLQRFFNPIKAIFKQNVREE